MKKGRMNELAKMVIKHIILLAIDTAIETMEKDLKKKVLPKKYQMTKYKLRKIIKEVKRNRKRTGGEITSIAPHPTRLKS